MVTGFTFVCGDVLDAVGFFSVDMLAVATTLLLLPLAVLERGEVNVIVDLKFDGGKVIVESDGVVFWPRRGVDQQGVVAVDFSSFVVGMLVMLINLMGGVVFKL
jgi:hypothetical protein